MTAADKRLAALARGRLTLAARHLAKRVAAAGEGWPEKLVRGDPALLGAFSWALAALAGWAGCELGAVPRPLPGGAGYLVEAPHLLVPCLHAGTAQEVVPSLLARGKEVRAEALAGAKEFVPAALLDLLPLVARYPRLSAAVWALRGEELVPFDACELARQIAAGVGKRGGPVKACGGEVLSYRLFKLCQEVSSRR
ncbi:hypothetical protein [Desulfovirgula thermocuniculi]|uniref:hypothetical protein n=1 Tax=Desulfovirgula thermocuniculi TaxID=348842 RepID=UPI000427F219|nr:hypothetical protein [Desulfovirgula thermocuniculi]